jgi:hypothetical protein
VELVGDGVREGCAEHGDGGGEHHAGPVAVADGPDGLEQGAGAVQVDAVALVEIGLGLARDDGGEVEDDVRPLRDEPLRLARPRQVGRPNLDRERRSGRGLRGDHVGERRAGDGAVAEGAVPRQALHELAADHAGGAENENVHGASRSGVLRRPACLDRDRGRRHPFAVGPDAPPLDA